MKLHNRIPVEPLDEQRLTNIERRLVVGVSELAMTKQRRSFDVRRVLAVAGVSAAVAAAVLVGWKLHGPEAVQQPAQVAQVQRFTIDTAATNQQVLSLDGATIAYGAATFDVARSVDPAHASLDRVVFEMKRGKLDLAVEHRPGRVLVVRAGDTDIEDIGTHFSVDYDGSTVAVRVTEGEVKVRRQQHDVRVAAGSAWTTSRGLVALAELDAQVVAEVTPPAPAPVVTPPLRDHQASVPVVPVPHVDTRERTAHVAPTAEHEPPRHPLPTVESVDPYLELRAAIRKQPVAFDPKIDGKTDAATTIAKLKKIAYSPNNLGEEASLATYQIAVLLYRPLGQDAEAMRTLELYLRRFTGGPQRPAALWLRVRIACGHTIDDDCRRAAYTYQHEVTSGEAADVAVRITNAQ